MDLLPCPFCGVDAGDTQTTPGISIEYTRHSVYCMDCSSEGPLAYTKERAIELWNTRPAPKEAPSEASRGEEGPGEADCGMCKGRGFYGSPGGRCEFCKGTGKVKFWRPRAPATPGTPGGGR